jgi:hypothetical protein
MRCEVRAGLRFEHVGHEVVVLDASGGTVHRLDGEAAEALRLVLADEAVPAHLEGAVDGLRDASIVEEPSGWSRRKALLAGGVGVATAATGFFSMALPAAALASSCPGGLQPGAVPLDALNMTQTFAMAGTFNLQIGFLDGATTGTVTVQLWGGGGGGGQGGSGESGGGGGGGGFRTATLAVEPCRVYPVTVGAGGAQGVGGGMADGMPGTSSVFLSAVATGGSAGMGSTISGGDGGTGGTGSFTGGDGADGTGSGFSGGGGGGAGAGSTMDGADGSGSVGGPAAGGGGMGANGAFFQGATTGGVPGGGGGGGGSSNIGQPSAGGNGQVTISLA